MSISKINSSINELTMNEFKNNKVSNSSLMSLRNTQMCVSFQIPYIHILSQFKLKFNNFIKDKVLPSHSGCKTLCFFANNNCEICLSTSYNCLRNDFYVLMNRRRICEVIRSQVDTENSPQIFIFSTSYCSCFVKSEAD